VTGCDADFSGLLEKYRWARGDRPFILVSPCTFSNTNAIEGWLLDHYRRFYPDDVIRQAERDRYGWDMEGLLEVIEDVRRVYGGEDGVYLTGFSGGGLLTYRMLVRHPKRLAGAVAVCANYFGESAMSYGPPPADTPIRVLDGGRDPHGYYFFGGHLLPPLPVLFGAVVVAGVVLWRMTGWVKAAVALTAVGLVLAWVNHSAGIHSQSVAAVRLLRDFGYTDVRREVVPAMGHEPAPELAVAVVDAATGIAAPRSR
jgi:pimeloyl-ACP methyl ester carboxylesterase